MIDNFTRQITLLITLAILSVAMLAWMLKSLHWIPFGLIMAGLAVGIGLGSGFYIRGQMRPLWRLIGAARRLGQGDLYTPIQTDSKLSEVRSLSESLEKSRLSLAYHMDELSKAKDWSETLLQSIVEGIITCDADRRVVFFSEGASRLGLTSQSAVIGQPLQAVIGNAEQWWAIPPTTQRLLTVTPTQTIAVTRLRANSAGQSTFVIRDMTEQLGHQRLQAYFLANVSHEFRTPLAGMKVSIELLLENLRYLSLSEMYQLLNSLYLSVSSLQNLIDNLLESSKIEADHLTLRRESTDLTQLLADAIRLIQPFLTRREQTLSLEAPLELPSLLVDRHRVVQVLVNLLSNASKYSPMGTPIDLIIRDHGTQVYIAIADRGQGIPPAERAEIFRRFVRLGLKSSEDYGVGLGLAVVKAIVEAHQGAVGIEGRDGPGSQFWFTLPKEING
jgi:signal transduction histidine kinase